MYWFLYIAFTLSFLYLIRDFFNKNFIILYILFTILITPAQIDLFSTNYAPAIFTFIFNIVLEKEYSMRALRPLLLSVPLSLLFVGLYNFVKRKFS